MEPLLIGGLVVVAALMGIGGTYLVVRRSPPVTVREPAPPIPK